MKTTEYNLEELAKASPDRIAKVLFQHVHACLLVVRRCHQAVNHRVDDDRISLGRCERPATMRMKLSPTESKFLCDPCYGAFHYQRGDERFLEVPQAAAVRRYNTLTANLETLEAMRLPELLEAAELLLAALPPCPNAFADATICARCVHVIGPQNPFFELEAFMPHARASR